MTRLFNSFIICSIWRIGLVLSQQQALDDLIDELIDLDAYVPLDDLSEDEFALPLTEASSEVSKQNPIMNSTASLEMSFEVDGSDGIRDVITVESYLESLSNADLEAICRERGFPFERDNLDHSNYVKAAERCLNLSDEINAILAENPDLAAELECEIERIALEKERLLLEREALLEEKEILEKKLRKAGIPFNVTSNSGETRLSYNPQSGIEVFRESITMLVDRVGSDMRLVGKAIRLFVFKPVLGILSMVWRYFSPAMEALMIKVFIFVEQFLQTTQLQVKMKSAIVKPIRSCMAPLQPHLSKLSTLAWSNGVEVTNRLHQNKQVRNISAVLRAIIGPIYTAMTEGWIDIQLDMQYILFKAKVWTRRLRNESKIQDDTAVK